MRSAGEWGIVVSVGSSKTIQFKERTLDIPVVLASSSPLCAVTLLCDHFRPLFMIPKGWKLVPLQYPLALKKLKTWGSLVCPMKDIGFHSLRCGAATHMSTIGIKLEDIKASGDWASLAVLIYLTTPLSHKVSVDKIVAKSLS